MFELHGQTAIVTGGSQGIGFAISERLAQAGATVSIADINHQKATQSAASIGKNCFALHSDVTDDASVRETVAETLRRTGRIDILVNNAGIAGRVAPIEELEDKDWQTVLAVNLSGALYFCRAVVPHMRARRYGRIVNIASIAGKEGNPGMIPYSVSKAGVIALTKSLGKELATQGICVNAVAPAVVQTQILDQLTPEKIAYMTQRIPMGRTGRPEEIAAVVHFLASTDSSFVTGQCYDASGGRATY